MTQDINRDHSIRQIQRQLYSFADGICKDCQRPFEKRFKAQMYCYECRSKLTRAIAENHSSRRKYWSTKKERNQ